MSKKEIHKILETFDRLGENATSGATASGSVAPVAGTLSNDPIRRNKTKRKRKTQESNYPDNFTGTPYDDEPSDNQYDRDYEDAKYVVRSEVINFFREGLHDSDYDLSDEAGFDGAMEYIMDRVYDELEQYETVDDETKNTIIRGYLNSGMEKFGNG